MCSPDCLSEQSPRQEAQHFFLHLSYIPSYDLNRMCVRFGLVSGWMLAFAAFALFPAATDEMEMEVTVGLEPTKTSFAGWCLDRFGIATKSVVRKAHTQNRTQIAPFARIYAQSGLSNLLKPRRVVSNIGFCRLSPYHLATAPWLTNRFRLPFQTRCKSRSFRAKSAR
jgi:hypothetical protein